MSKYIYVYSFNKFSFEKKESEKETGKSLRRDIHSWMHPSLDSCSLKPNDTSVLFFPINNSKINEEIGLDRFYLFADFSIMFD